VADEEPQPRIETAKRVGRPPITLPDRLAIASLHARGHSDAQIARALRLTPSDCRSAREDARAVLEASAVALVTDYLTASDIAARKGDHRPARDMLDRLHVTEPTPPEQAPAGVTVQVVGFTLPGLPIQVQAGGMLTTTEPQGAPAPAIDTLALPARSTETNE
jgi:hypothetical protein